MKSLYEQSVDVEAMIKNLRPSKNIIYNGYRPAFKVKSNYLTSGEIRFKDVREIEFGDIALAEIRFITPQCYPHCLEIGQVLEFQEGFSVHGYATITKIYNKILEKESSSF